MSKDKDDIHSTKQRLEETIIKILKRNQDLLKKLSDIDNAKEFTSEDEPDNIKTNINILSKDLSIASKASSDLLSLINSKYISSISKEQYQKIKFAHSKASKILSQEIELFNSSKAKFTLLSSSLPKRKSSLSEENNSNGNSEDDNDNEDSERAHMIPKSQILSLDHLIKNKNEQVDNIYKKTLLVNEIAKEINSITHIQEEKMEDIEENIAQVQNNAKDTYQSTFEVSQQDKRYKVNNCYVLLLLLVLIIVIFIILIKN